MLNEIQSDTLDHLLTAVRLGVDSTQIPAPDAHLPPTILSPLASLGFGDTIEIQGPPSSGKTHLLYFLLLNCITPSVHLSTTLGGWGKAAIVLDTDGSFDIIRFNHLLLGRLARLFPSDAHTAQTVAKKSLEKLHIFRPTSSTQLANTIAYLSTYHAVRLPDDGIGLVAVDSIGAHYWPDRFTVEQIQSVSVSRNAGPMLTPALQYISTALQSFRLSHGSIMVLINRDPYLAPDASSALAGLRGRPLPALFAVRRSDAPHPNVNINVNVALPTDTLDLTHHITLSTAFVPQLHQMVSTENAKAHGTYRTEVIAKGEVAGLVRFQNCSSVGRFALYIAADDIFVT